MEMWELVKRILALAGEGQSFTPSLAGSTYRRVLESLGETDLPPVDEFHNWAEMLAEQMEFVGLLEGVSIPNRGLSILGVVRRTEFGDELYESLQGHNVVLLFESMLVTIDEGDIRRILHQLQS